MTDNTPIPEFLTLVAAERRRQVESHGYTAQHDDAEGPTHLFHWANYYWVKGDVVAAAALAEAAREALGRRWLRSGGLTRDADKIAAESAVQRQTAYPEGAARHVAYIAAAENASSAARSEDPDQVVAAAHDALRRMERGGDNPADVDALRGLLEHHETITSQRDSLRLAWEEAEARIAGLLRPDASSAARSEDLALDRAIIALNNRIASTIDALPPTASARKSPDLMIHVRIADIEAVIGAARDAQIAAHASSAARPDVIPAGAVDTASIRSVSLEREGVGLGRITSVEMTFTNVSPEVMAIITGTPVVDLDVLQSLAREASPGLWEVNEGDDEITLDKGTALTRWNDEGTVGYPARSWRTTDRLVEIDPEDYTEDEVEGVVADLQYIAAARPEVMLALIERLRAAEAGIADARTITLDLTTGEWLSSPRGGITGEEGQRVAAAVLPGMPVEEVARAYGAYMSDDPAPADSCKGRSDADLIETVGQNAARVRAERLRADGHGIDAGLFKENGPLVKPESAVTIEPEAS